MAFQQPSADEAARAAERHEVRRLELPKLELLLMKQRRDWVGFLKGAVRLKRNIVLAGKTGSGKTTLARSLIEEGPSSERMVTIEEVHELALPSHPNRVHLLCGEEEGRVSAEACLAMCMRLSPARIFLPSCGGTRPGPTCEGSAPGTRGA